MTEKRYSYYKSPITGLFVISDEKNKETFSGIDDEYNCSRIVRLLNTKEEENEELKQDLKKQFIPFAKTDEDYTTVNTEEFIKILNKNEQLYQENNNLRDFRKKLKKEKEYWKTNACSKSNYLSILSMDCWIVEEAILNLKNVIDVDTEAYNLLDELSDKFNELQEHRINWSYNFTKEIPDKKIR